MPMIQRKRTVIIFNAFPFNFIFEIYSFENVVNAIVMIGYSENNFVHLKMVSIKKMIFKKKIFILLLLKLCQLKKSIPRIRRDDKLFV